VGKTRLPHCAFRRKMRSFAIAGIAAAAGLTTIAATAHAGVVAAGAYAFDLDVSLTITQPPFAPRTIAFGPVNLVTASGPSSSSSFTIPVFGPLGPIFSYHALSSSASTSFTPGGNGNATATASTGSFLVSLFPILTFAGSSIVATVNSFDTGFAIGRTASTTFTGEALTVFGTPVVASSAPAFNTVAYSAGGVVVTLNAEPALPFPDELVDAINISLTAVPFNPFGGTITGSIIIDEAATALALAPLPGAPPIPVPPVAVPEPGPGPILELVPEPGSAWLLASGLAVLCLGSTSRRRERRRG